MEIANQNQSNSKHIKSVNHLIETKSIIHASKITKMVASTSQDQTAECTQNKIINSSWQRVCSYEMNRQE